VNRDLADHADAARRHRLGGSGVLLDVSSATAKPATALDGGILRGANWTSPTRRSNIAR